jgi:putative nucleotidyltransferase with HDIG domain
MAVPAAIQPRLKEILYSCLEEIQAKRAALYLLEEDGNFHVASQYGFRRGLREVLEPRDDLVDILTVRRSAFAINSLTEDSRFAEVLYDADTTRMLVAPIFSRGKLAGFIDLRDKSGGRAFETADFRAAQKITDQYLELFAEEELYGQRRITVVEADQQRAELSDGRTALPSIVERASAEIARGVLLEGPTLDQGLDARIEAASGMLPAFLGLRSIALAAISVFGETGGQQRIAAKGEVSDEALDQFTTRLRLWLEKQGEGLPHLRTEVALPFGKVEDPIPAARVKSLLGAPIRAAEPRKMILSVVFERKPDEETRKHLEALHGALEKVVENVLAAEQLSQVRLKAAERLLEPELESHPDMMLHARRVAELSFQVARKAGLPASQAEKIRLAGLVHDVGLRLLGFQRPQMKKLSQSETAIVRKHPMVGAAIVASSPLGPEVARIVYAHHERVDGKGYPEGLEGSQLPLGARIIQICEAYDAMTSQHSYKTPVPEKVALERLKNEAGRQFDADLVDIFCAVIEEAGYRDEE